MKRKGQESENPVEQEQSAKVGLPHTKDKCVCNVALYFIVPYLHQKTHHSRH